jgi:hypothetical protein
VLSFTLSITPSTADRQMAAATSTTNAVCVTNTNCTVGLTTEASSGTTTSPATCQPRCTPCPSNQALQVSADGCGTCSTLASAAAGNVYNSLHLSSFCSQLSLFFSCFVVVCLCVCVCLSAIDGYNPRLRRVNRVCEHAHTFVTDGDDLNVVPFPFFLTRVEQSCRTV